MSPTRPSARRAIGRLAVVGAAFVALLTVGAGIASAHVTVSSPNAEPDGYGTVVFTVPNESDTASTTRLRIQLPPKTPFAQVLVQPVPGWTVTTTTTTLATPITNDDGDKVTSAISVVDFQATGGGGIPPGQFQQFTLSVGPFPKASSMSFSTIQTYSDGTEVAWIEPTVEGQPEPQHPAPTLSLTSSAPAAAASDDSSTTSSSDSGSGRDALTLFLAILALVVALGAAALAWRAGRRTVSS